MKTSAGQSSFLENVNDGEYETVLAATAYAITNFEEEGVLNVEKKAEELAKIRSKHEEKITRTNFDLPFEKLNGEAKVDEKQTVSGTNIRHESEEVENAARINNNGKEELITFPKDKTSSNYLEKKGSKKLQSGEETVVGLKTTSTKKPQEVYSFGHKSLKEDAKKGDKTETEADAWEKAKLTNSYNRYKKMVAVISEWQAEKKAKAKHRLEKKQDEPVHKRTKALQLFNNEMSRINKIAGDAKALADEKKQNDDMKIREKAAKIRLTGKLPGDCCSCY